ncbi:MAG: porin family protein [Mucilaginibacter sp.]
MKKILTTLFAVMGIYAASHAQSKNEFGIGGGVSGSSIYVSDQKDYTPAKTGFNLYIADEQYFSDRWGIKFKLIYDQKGWMENTITSYSQSPFTFPNSYYNVKFYLNYITVPVMANWHFGRTRNWYLNFGPYIGFLTSATYDINKSMDLKSAYNSTDAGLALGIGVKIPLSKGTKFFIEYDGQGGGSNIVKNGSAGNNARSSFNVGFDF